MYAARKAPYCFGLSPFPSPELSLRMGQSQSSSTEVPAGSDSNMADTLSSIKDLLDSKKYSDLTLKCKGKGFKVYRAIVCTRSAFLSKAIDGDFKEATLGEIDLSADELSVIEAMIKYLYTDDYPDTALVRSDSTGATSSMIGAPLSSSNIDNAYALLFNVKMYVCGDKLDISGLRTLATKKY